MTFLDIRKLLRALAALVGLVVLLDLLFRLLTPEGFLPELLARFVHLDEEGSFPTYLASLLLTSCGLAALWLGRLERRPFPGWTGLGLLFLAAGVDEVAAVHERFNGPVRRLLAIDPEGGWLRFAWILPAGLVVLLALLLFWRFARALDPTSRRRLAVALLLYLTGALLLELPGGFASVRYGFESLPYTLVSVAEEALEFAGTLLFLRALLLRLRALGPARLELA